MKRSPSYWAWLLTDLALDRTIPVTPLIGLDTPGRLALRHAVDATGPALSITNEALEDAVHAVLRQAAAALGVNRAGTAAWLGQFPFVSAEDYPALHYWSSRFEQIFASHGPTRLEGLPDDHWRAVKRAWVARPPGTTNPMTAALTLAGEARSRYFAVSDAIEDARTRPMTSHDLDIYLRWEWNDAGSGGMDSLEIGARLQAARDFWRAVSPFVPADALEAIAHEQDLSCWTANQDPQRFTAEAAHYGVNAADMRDHLFPRPGMPPSLDDLLVPTE